MASKTSIVRPFPSATVLVIRDSLKGLEVLMVWRAKAIEFAGGALAFPGGKVTTGDQDVSLRRRLVVNRGVHRITLARQFAAVREVFEESGLLLLNEGRSHRRVSEARRADMARIWRRGLSNNRSELRDMMRAHGLYFDPRALIPFAHWVTPPFVGQRFDTSFFLARAPKGHKVEHDGWETVHAQWMRPQDVLEAEREGRFRMMFPTRLNLMRLEQAHSVADAFSQARKQPIITVMPVIFKENGILKGRVPPNAGYGEVNVFERSP